MGWSIDLISDRKITEEEVDKLVSNLPQEMSFVLGNSKQPWGWSTAVDVAIKDEYVIWLSGSYGMSGAIAEKFTIHMKDELEKIGHTISLIDRR
ncbi:hypothetical protein [Paenibacillus sp. O199]|uniref:hypothetical protein n=1 Tax=Paenibacillus sp. O199 TaxID=1643925 RepID=UPI0007BF1D14|nr:hypothetical protein [Paenibacillus sp. O199]